MNTEIWERILRGELCARCSGWGEILPPGNPPDETIPCPACGGTGRPRGVKMKRLRIKRQADDDEPIPFI